MNLKQFFPTEVELEGATVPAVAGALLKVLFHEFGDYRNFHIRNVIIGVRSLYPTRSWECGRAASEGLAWLLGQTLICQAPDGDLGWFNLTRAGLEAAATSNFEKWSAEREVPVALLHPSIVRECMDSFRLGKFDTAVFEAFKTLEVAIRNGARLKPSDIGVPLARKAFHSEGGPLSDMTQEGGERQALCDLMAGAIGSYKNPYSHRKVDIGAAEAREMLILASHLLRITEARAVI